MQDWIPFIVTANRAVPHVSQAPIALVNLQAVVTNCQDLWAIVLDAERLTMEDSGLDKYDTCYAAFSSESPVYPECLGFFIASEWSHDFLHGKLRGDTHFAALPWVSSPADRFRSILLYRHSFPVSSTSKLRSHHHENLDRHYEPLYNAEDGGKAFKQRLRKISILQPLHR